MAIITTLLVVLFIIAPIVTYAKTTVTSHKDSDGYEHSTISDGKHTTHCTTHTDSSKVVHTKCDK